MSEYIKTSEAAILLNVHRNTLFNWDRKKIFVPRRHPINNHRLYNKSDLEKLLKKIKGQ